jgi:4-oxalocrotonate tautomerase
MPVVQVDFAQGRTLEQKREMAKRVTEAISDTLKCPQEAVEIVMREIPLNSFAVGGKLLGEK